MLVFHISLYFAFVAGLAALLTALGTRGQVSPRAIPAFLLLLALQAADLVWFLILILGGNDVGSLVWGMTVRSKWWTLLTVLNLVGCIVCMSFRSSHQLRIVSVLGACSFVAAAGFQSLLFLAIGT